MGNQIAPTLSITKPAMKWMNAYLTRMQNEGIVCEKATITPDRAAALLSRNPENRNIREAKVAQMVSDMTDGNFQFNGEPVIVANDGSLNDGQHRLFACVKSGQAFETIIVFGPERDSRYTIDTGSARSASDHLALKGVSNTSTAAAMARYILSFEREGTFSKRGSISSQEQINRVTSDPLILEIAAWCDSRRHRMRNLLKSSVAGFMFYLIAEKAPREAKVFMEQLALGTGLDGKSPIYLLREKLLHNDLNELMKIEAFVRAWNHWCHSPTTAISRLQLMGNIPEIASPSWAFSKTEDEKHNLLPATSADDFIVIKSRRKRKVVA